jgi:hypothetical protein
MSILSGILHRLSKSHRSSNRVYKPVHQLSPAEGVNHLLSLGVIAEWSVVPRLTEGGHDSTYWILPDAFDLAQIPYPFGSSDLDILIYGEQCANISHLIDKYGLAGLTAWLHKALRVQPMERAADRAAFIIACDWIDDWPSLEPKYFTSGGEVRSSINPWGIYRAQGINRKAR